VNKKIHKCNLCGAEFYFNALKEYVYCPNCGLVFKNKYMRICKHCGKEFVLTRYANAEYCDNIPNGEVKTCKEIGAHKTFEGKVKNDDILTEYRRAYKRKYSKVLTKKMSKSEFKSWSGVAKEKLNQAQNGKLSVDEFIGWLKGRD
jgi:DNA-directed RNA polymerase subunit RPC12/RpoP